MLVFLAMVSSGFSQSSKKQDRIPAPSDTLGPCHPNGIFLSASKKPQYGESPGSLEQDLNAAYKPDLNIEGAIALQFVISCKGYVSNIVILRGLNSEINSGICNELLRLQKWQPAYQQLPVDYLMRLTIKIKGGKLTISEI